MNRPPQTDRKLALKAHEQVKFCSDPVRSEDYFPEWKPALKGQCHAIFTKNLLYSKNILKVFKLYIVNSSSWNVYRYVRIIILDLDDLPKRDFFCLPTENQNDNIIELNPPLVMTIRTSEQNFSCVRYWLM